MNRPAIVRGSIALAAYVALLLAFWLAARRFGAVRSLEGHFACAFAGFALLLAPYWAFGFGAASTIRAALRSRLLRVFLPALLIVPYLTYAVPAGQLRAGYSAAFVCLPVFMAAILEFAPSGGWIPEALVLLIAGLPVEFGWFRDAWPQRGLGAMPKLLLMDALLYAFLVIRRFPDVGYDLRPRRRDLLAGLREWAWFAPLGIGLGLALGFIHWRGFAAARISTLAAGWLVTFFFVALPEELLFRGLLQNLLERTLAQRGNKRSGMWALWTASSIFGLSHFNKPLPFNWRYVVLATVAGLFYGRAWRDRRRLFCSGITHATVDVVWSVWFR
jgi:membrane protease YdiL (CAAX protease family)